MNSTLNFIDGHQISYAVAGACALFLFLLLLFEFLRTRLYWIYEPRVHRDDYRCSGPRGRRAGGDCGRPAAGPPILVWRRRRRLEDVVGLMPLSRAGADLRTHGDGLGIVLWGLAGLEERPERNVVL